MVIVGATEPSGSSEKQQVFTEHLGSTYDTCDFQTQASYDTLGL